MIKELVYGGLANQPSEYECADGQLACSFNLINEDGHLAPIYQPKSIADGIDNKYTVLFIHENATYSHIILQNTLTYSLHWLSKNNLPRQFNINQIIADRDHTISTPEPVDSVLQITSMGNTLIILTNSGLHYIRWKGADPLYDVNAGYYYIGQKPPFVSLRFSTSKNYPTPQLGNVNSFDYRTTDKTYVNAPAPGLVIDAQTHKIVNNFQKDITEFAWALINKTNAEITNAGHFYAPFLVRYCYRLFDGSTIMHSAPVLMPISYPFTYPVYCNNVIEVPGYTDFYVTDFGDDRTNGIPVMLTYAPTNVALTYQCTDNDKLEELRNNWGDIIKSIDIYISQPLVRELDNENIEQFEKAPFHIFADINGGETGDTYGFPGSINQHNWDLERTIVSGTPRKTDWFLKIPKLSDEAYLNKIKSTASFYHVKTFKLDTDIPTSANEWREIKLDMSASESASKLDTLNALATHEAMADDYKSFHQIYPLLTVDNIINSGVITNLFTYNSRLHVSGIIEKLFTGFSPSDLVADMSANLLFNSSIQVLGIFIYLNTDEGGKFVFNLYEDEGGIEVSPFLFEIAPLYYPDNRATKMIVKFRYSSAGNIHYTEYKMESCPTMNGSYTTGRIPSTLTILPENYEETHDPYTPPEESTVHTSDREVAYANKIYTSEANNPFVFPASGIVTVGVGIIIGAQSATKALSQGQYGQFPLYVFATDGVWTLSVSDTGTYTQVYPVSRDVCINKDSITSLDTSVVFVSDRGLLQLIGSEVIPLSDIINAKDPFNTALLAHFYEIATQHGIVTPSQTGIDLIEFLKKSFIIYDYKHQRIIIANSMMDEDGMAPLYNYALVFSLKTRMWGMMRSDVLYKTNSYPDAIAVAGGRHTFLKRSVSIVSYSDTDETISNGLVVTRPLKLDAFNILKSVHTVIQRGYFERGDVKTIIYASNDLQHWYVIGSSTDHQLRRMRGTSYKFFRIAGLISIERGESVYGATIEFDIRHTDKLR